MDFFENQERARRKTALLVVYYILAVIMIIVALYSALHLIFSFVQASETSPQGQEVVTGYWDPGLFLLVAFGALLVISFGTIYKVRQLSSGGSSVAKLLGGILVEPGTGEPRERMLLNVVEEMSIASGVPVPAVFVLAREEAINAFAAGFTPDDAVIGVTRGALEKLSREELQGVIAHEFSHILYGDMRINLRLMGILHGILVIAFIGSGILRRLFFFSGSRRSRGRGGNVLLAGLLGLALLSIGYIGVFFGNLIKSAVSRQREFLADASALQFTRNPSGLAGALKKIAGLDKAAVIKNRHSHEARHLFFSEEVSSFSTKLTATHPPVEERIKRIDPHLEFDRESLSGNFVKKTRASASAGASGESVKRNEGLSFASGVSPEEVLSAIGTTGLLYLDHAKEIIKNIPDRLLKAAHKLPDAEAVVYCLLLSRDQKIKNIQKAQIKEYASKEVSDVMEDMLQFTEKLPVEYRLPLVDIAISALKRSSGSSSVTFKENIRRMISSDSKVSIFEYAVHKIVIKHLTPGFDKKASYDPVIYKKLEPLRVFCITFLANLARYGVDDEKKKSDAFRAGCQKLEIKPAPHFLSEDPEGLIRLDQALEEIDKASAPVKRRVIDAGITCVLSDGKVTVEQAELIRVVADAIGCPIPPLFPGKRP